MMSPMLIGTIILTLGWIWSLRWIAQWVTAGMRNELNTLARTLDETRKMLIDTQRDVNHLQQNQVPNYSHQLRDLLAWRQQCETILEQFNRCQEQTQVKIRNVDAMCQTLDRDLDRLEQSHHQHRQNLSVVTDVVRKMKTGSVSHLQTEVDALKDLIRATPRGEVKRPSSVERKSSSPSKSLGVKTIETFLTQNNIHFETEWKFPGLRHKRELKSDFYTQDPVSIIEYDGHSAHFNDPRQKLRDRKKNSYFRENNIPILRIAGEVNPDVLADWFVKVRDGINLGFNPESGFVPHLFWVHGEDYVTLNREFGLYHDDDDKGLPLRLNGLGKPGLYTAEI